MEQKITEMGTAELGLAYGKLIEQIYQMQLQANAVEQELQTRKPEDEPCEDAEDIITEVV